VVEAQLGTNVLRTLETQHSLLETMDLDMHIRNGEDARHEMQQEQVAGASRDAAPGVAFSCYLMHHECLLRREHQLQGPMENEQSTDLSHLEYTAAAGAEPGNRAPGLGLLAEVVGHMPHTWGEVGQLPARQCARARMPVSGRILA
jgi:hypothetical protein